MLVGGEWDGVAGGSGVPVAPLPIPPSVLPAGPGAAAELMDELAGFVARLDEWPGALFQLGEEQLGDFVAAMVGLAARAESLAVVGAAEAVARGVVASSTAADPAGWVAGCITDRGISAYLAVSDPVVVRRVGAAARECADPKNKVVADVLAAGVVTVSCARVAVREAPGVLCVVPGADRNEVLSWFLAASRTDARTLRDLSARVIGRFAPEVLMVEEERAQVGESLSWADLPNGLSRLTADLSAGHAAILKHAIGALSAPQPATCTDLTSADAVPVVVERDPRTPGKRRSDALVELGGVAARMLDGGRSHTTGNVAGSAKVVVTVDYQTLIGELAKIGQLPGLGQSISGDLVDAGTARRLACDADVIPVVLGGDSEPLDVGRTKRLFTGGLRTAVIHRDQGCTFPGCERPPDWCDAHHLIPWWAGGETSLANAALLCTRHHTIVHRDLLLADVTASGVIWDPTPGRMPNRADRERAA